MGIRMNEQAMMLGPEKKSTKVGMLEKKWESVTLLSFNVT